jgi:hypothetical protein
MFSRVRIAIRFFFVGLAVGVLLAPRSGEETRRMVRQKADRLLNDVLDAATLGTVESVNVSDEELSQTEQVEPPKRSGRSNGGTRGRSRAATSSGSSSSGS